MAVLKKKKAKEFFLENFLKKEKSLPYLRGNLFMRIGGGEKKIEKVLGFKINLFL